MDLNDSWIITTNNNSLRISSTEQDSNIKKGLPLDVEILQNLIENICRKFDTSNGENLLCFGGCAIYNSDGTLNRVESFVPKYPSFLKQWLKISKDIEKSLHQVGKESILDEEESLESVGNIVLETGERLESLKGEDGSILVRSTVNSDVQSSHSLSELNSCHEKKPTPKKQKSLKYKIKAGVPVPPRPVLCLNQEETKDWFPCLLEKLTSKKFPSSVLKNCSQWDGDVEKVLPLKDFTELGPRPELNWTSVSSNFYWKLKLVAAILLEKKGLDYTTFAENVEDKHEKYSTDDLILMSMSKNPETFEKLFVRKKSSQSETPSYVNEFERKSSEIILQNFRLISARDKRLINARDKINGNNVSKSRIGSESSKFPKVSKKMEKSMSQEESTSTMAVMDVPEKDSFKSLMNGIKVTPLIEVNALIDEPQSIQFNYQFHQETDQSKSKRRKSSILLCDETEQSKSKRIKSDSSKEERHVTKNSSNRFLCKNNFQKGDFLIHPSQLHSKFGPVKLVTYRRETKKTFLCLSEFETIDSKQDNFVIMEKSSHKSRSTPAKFLDSYIKINDLVEIIDKKSTKMKIKRHLPSGDSNSIEESHELKEEVIDLDDLVNDEAFDEELDELNDNEMVIDESRA